MSGLHYKANGTLDMRYSSSRAAMSSGFSGGGSSSGYGYSSSSFSGGSSGLHYKKDGSLDMRYSSSKAVSSGAISGSSSMAGSANSQIIHLKKDGTPDMRFSSSRGLGQQFSQMNMSERAGPAHYKKDGTLDMRFKSSKALSDIGIPAGIPLTKSGVPDMRTNAAKDWVSAQGRNSNGGLPFWLQKKKDGSAKPSSAAAAFIRSSMGEGNYANEFEFDHGCRRKYYEEKMSDNEMFRNLVKSERHRSQMVECVRRPILLGETQQIHAEMTKVNSVDEVSQIPMNVPLLDYGTLKASFRDEENCTIGRGSFGVVLKGSWKGKDVAVKRLHLTQLNKKEKITFVKELKILALLGDHPNLVSLYGYTVEPPCFVMEFVKLGTLSHILHYSEDPSIEAKMTCGLVKKQVLLGIVAGMRQIHAAGIIHGDLKPANVLLDDDFIPKITDFGLAALRGKSSSTIASTAGTNNEDNVIAGTNNEDNVIAGTGGYMAPELLDSSRRLDFSCDVYSFGVLLNEVVQEEEPYSGSFAKFQGRGPFGAANYARDGNRPHIKNETPELIKALIRACWNTNPKVRPTFNSIYDKILSLEIPNSF